MSTYKVRGLYEVLLLLITGITPTLFADRFEKVVSQHQPVERGANHTVWQGVVERTDPSTGVTRRETSSYTQLESGLNRRNARGEWVETGEGVELVGDMAVAKDRAYHASWRGNPNQQRLFEFVGAEGERLSGSVSALAYFDRTSGKSAIIATIRDSTGFIDQSGQEVLFFDSFDGIKADLRYKLFRAGIEQDVILRESPPSPESYGLDSATTHLEVWTEFFDSDTPKKQSVMIRQEQDAGKRKTMSEPDLFDELLVFGNYRMTFGRAFFEDRPGVAGDGERIIPIAKKWTEIDGRSFLVESAMFSDIQGELARLPKRVATTGSPSAERTILPAVEGRSGVRSLTASSPGSFGEQKMLADYRHDDAKGLVMDFTLVTSANNYTFSAGETYLVSGGVYMTGTTTFYSGAVIKYANVSWAKMSFDSSSWISTIGSNTVYLTCEDDDSVGEIITPPNNQSGRYAEAYLQFYNAPANIEVNYFQFRFANKAISAYSNTKHILRYCYFIACDMGIQSYYTDWDLYYTLYCSVPSLAYNYYGSTFTYYGYVSDNCASDADFDGLSNGFELTYFGHFNFGGADDLDGDGLSNLQEAALGYAPNNYDTDGDGIPDGGEDYDGDGLADFSDPSPLVVNGPASFAGRVIAYCPQ